MEKINLENAQKTLIAEFENATYSKAKPFGQAAVNRKVYDYILVCTNENISITECKEWIIELFKTENIGNNEDIIYMKGLIDAIYYIKEHKQSFLQ